METKEEGEGNEEHRKCLDIETKDGIEGSEEHKKCLGMETKEEAEGSEEHKKCLGMETKQEGEGSEEHRKCFDMETKEDAEVSEENRKCLDMETMEECEGNEERKKCLDMETKDECEGNEEHKKCLNMETKDEIEQSEEHKKCLGMETKEEAEGSEGHKKCLGMETKEESEESEMHRNCLDMETKEEAEVSEENRKCLDMETKKECEGNEERKKCLDMETKDKIERSEDYKKCLGMETKEEAEGSEEHKKCLGMETKEEAEGSEEHRNCLDMGTKEEAEVSEENRKCLDMETKEVDDGSEGQIPSPSRELNHVFEGTNKDVKVDGEAQKPEHSVSSGHSRLPPLGHRRSQSEVLAAEHKHNGSFHRLKTSMQKALRWGGTSRDERYRSGFNPEVLANQKRQWYQFHSKTMDKIKCEQPTSIFEHFIIAGIHPDTDLGTVEQTFARRKKWETYMRRSGVIDFKLLQNHGPPSPMFEPQILFRYPPGKKLAMRLKDLATFCFPGGVKAQLLERTPSFSELNELLYGQEHLGRDDLAFMFSLKVAGNATVYGVCLHVPELVKRQPGNLGGPSHLSATSLSSQFIVSAPRCYCLLTRVPFFELHYEMLNSIIAQERLNRITEFVSEMNPFLDDHEPSVSKQDDQMSDNTITDIPNGEYVNDWVASPIPVDTTVVLNSETAAHDGVLSASLKITSLSCDSIIVSEATDLGHVREIEKDVRKGVLYIDDNVPEASESRCNASERINGNLENGQSSPDIGFVSLRSLTSSQSLFSPARSLTSEDDEEDDDLFWNNEKQYGDDLILERAKENKNDLLQIVSGYHALAVPPRGSEIIFQPLEHLQAIEYVRPPISELAMDESYFYSFEAAEIIAKLSEAEEALALSVWTTSTICRVLSLDGILAVVAGVLLEKQIVVVCPNLGVLSAVVLSLIPIIRPFQWQSLLLPVLPKGMLDFLDAPVPFLVGVQHKPADLKMKSTNNLVQVNLLKKQVKTCYVPQLPQRKVLVSELGPLHAKLSYEGSIAKKHPTYRCNETQAEAATQFLAVMRDYLESLCENLRSHTITSVQSNHDKVSLLLKDSFIESFPTKDQSFIKLFVDTQLFSVLSDTRLSNYENE